MAIKPNKDAGPADKAAAPATEAPQVKNDRQWMLIGFDAIEHRKGITHLGETISDEIYNDLPESMRSAFIEKGATLSVGAYGKVPVSLRRFFKLA